MMKIAYIISSRLWKEEDVAFSTLRLGKMD